MKNYSAKIEGMHCTACAINIKDQLESLEGVNTANVNYSTKKIEIEYDEARIKKDVFEQEIKNLGYLVSSKNTDNENEYLKKEKRKLFFILPIALFIFAMMIWNMLTMNISQIERYTITIPYFDEILFLISTLVLFVGGRPFIKGLFTFVKGKGADMNTLIGLGTIIAYIYSTVILFLRYFQIENILQDNIYFEALITVIGFVIWGKYLEEKSRASTGSAIKDLIKLQSKTAILYKNGKEYEISINEIKKSDILIVKPGVKIPIDGVIIEGEALIDQSMLTGESIPVQKKVGDNIFGGTLNNQGYIKIKATKIGEETMLSTIIKLVEQAQNSKAPVEKLVDKISRVFVPTVIILATSSLLFWTLTDNFSIGISTFVATLVIACPCALGLATPTAIIVGVGRGAKKGILIKNAEKLQKLNTLNTIVFDKTGTLTNGKPQVTKIVSTITENETLTIASSLESKSQHPLAYAINEMAKKSNLILKNVTDFKNIDGMGVTGKIGGKIYYLGSTKYIESLKIKINKDYENSTVMILTDEENILAHIYIEDKIKDEAKDTIKHIHSLGIKTVLLSGDNKQVVNRIASELGVDETYSDVLPDQKSDIMKKLKERGTVAMVGDGINDAPALALADIGIAMATGTDIAIESSDIILLGGNLAKIPIAIKLSKEIMITIKQNLFWAFVYNIIGIPLAMGVFSPIFGVFLNPAFAGAAMSFSSISVVLNSLRLKLKKL